MALRTSMWICHAVGTVWPGGGGPRHLLCAGDQLRSRGSFGTHPVAHAWVLPAGMTSGDGCAGTSAGTARFFCFGFGGEAGPAFPSLGLGLGLGLG